MGARRFVPLRGLRQRLHRRTPSAGRAYGVPWLRAGCLWRLCASSEPVGGIPAPDCQECPPRWASVRLSACRRPDRRGRSGADRSFPQRGHQTRARPRGASPGGFHAWGACRIGGRCDEVGSELRGQAMTTAQNRKHAHGNGQMRNPRATLCPSLQKTVMRDWRPGSKAQQPRLTRLFHVPMGVMLCCMASPMVGRVGASSDAPVLARYANPARSAAPHWRGGRQVQHLSFRSHHG